MTDILKWRSIHLTHNPTKKPILKGLQGSVKSGEMYCIMGQSGAGKSSFVSILTGRITKKTRNFTLEGQVTMNGHHYNGFSFGKFAAYVRQDDILMGTLTVEETFDFQSQLKLTNLTTEERNYEVNKLLKKLELYECRQSRVGGQFSKSISGGQKKRVSIGIQLLSNPVCLILDEPTSGLDSAISLTLMRLLKSIASEGKIIIATIHQPSTLIFNEMQKLLLLSKGQAVYQGQAKQIVPYMEKIGVKINKRMNPADFFMLQISQYKVSQGYSTPMTSERFRREQKNYNIPSEIQQKDTLPDNTHQMASFFTQIKHLTRRTSKNFFRVPANIVGKVFLLIGMPMLIGILYFKIGGRVPDITETEELQKYLLELTAFVFISAFFNFGGNVYDNTLTFPKQKQLALKETSSGLYSMTSYFLCRCIVQMPLSLIVTMIAGIIIFFATQLDSNTETFLVFVGIYVLQAAAGYSMGIFIGAMFTTPQMAIQILPLIIIPVFVFGGLSVNLNDVPAFSSWIQYLSVIRHGYSVLMLNLLSTDKMYHLADLEEVREFCGINGTQKINTILLIACIVGFLGISLLILILKKRAI